MNDPVLMLSVLVALLLIVAAVAINYNLRVVKSIESQYRKLGEELGLEYEQPPPMVGGLMPKMPMVSGDYVGRQIAIFCKGYGLDSTRQTDTAIRMAVNSPKGLKMTLSPRNMLGKVGQVARGKETKTGDAAFDAAYLLRSNQPEIAQAIFDEQTREQLQSATRRKSAFLSVDEGALMYVEFGLLRDDESRNALKETLSAMNIIAAKIDVA